MELKYEPIVKQNSRIFHHAPFSSSALCETFKRTQHVSTFCSFILLASAFITYVGDQCDVFFPHTFFRYQINGTKTLIGELLCVVYPLSRNVALLSLLVE